MSIEEDFDNLPRWLFLDSCTIQTIEQHGAFIWEGEPPSETDSIYRVEGGPANLAALRDIFLVNEQAFSRGSRDICISHLRLYEPSSWLSRVRSEAG